MTLPVGPTRCHELEREVARSAAHVKSGVAWLELGPIRCPLAPVVMKPDGHRRVHQVIDARDAVEHPPNLARELIAVGPRRRASAHNRRLNSGAARLRLTAARLGT